jgi:hypothetical protein
MLHTNFADTNKEFIRSLVPQLYNETQNLFANWGCTHEIKFRLALVPNSGRNKCFTSKLHTEHVVVIAVCTRYEVVISTNVDTNKHIDGLLIYLLGLGKQINWLLVVY